MRLKREFHSCWKGAEFFNKAAFHFRLLLRWTLALFLFGHYSLHRNTGLAGCKSQLGGSLDMADLLRPGACLWAFQSYISQLQDLIHSYETGCLLYGI